MDDERSRMIAKRLRDCRINAGLSHDALAKAILDKYKINISRDSLINYEVIGEKHKKFGSNMGMRLEYLIVFADFYNVSADWLLGITGIQNPEAVFQEMSQFTGLSDIALQALNTEVEENEIKTYAIDALLCSDYFHEFNLDLYYAFCKRSKIRTSKDMYPADYLDWRAATTLRLITQRGYPCKSILFEKNHGSYYTNYMVRNYAPEEPNQELQEE